MTEHGKVAKTALEQIKMRVAKSAFTQLDEVVFVTGSWFDDGDRIPEDGEDIHCNGHLQTVLAYKAG